jgi:acetyltransferase-like isoleucine patch superfamily enzyme
MPASPSPIRPIAPLPALPVARLTRLSGWCGGFARSGGNGRPAITARAAVAGWVEVGDGAYLGMGCTVIQGVKIGRNALVGMGAVVLCDVPENAIVVGNPARFLRLRTTEGRA